MKIYLVKFNCGYYAESQPNYQWSYTNDIFLAKRYKNLKSAKERAVWGVSLGKKTYNPENISDVTIEEYELVETFTLKSTLLINEKIT